MAASASDKFKKLSRRWVGQIGAGGVADASVTTVPLSSATNLPTGTGVVVVIDRVNASGVATPSSEETIVGVVSGLNLVSCTRGAEGTAQAHSAGAVVEVLVTAIGWNDMVDGITNDHSQLGYHTDGLTKIRNTTDATKILKWDVSGATTGKTMTLAPVHTVDRTVTLPDATDTLVGKATTDTLTNKTITTANTIKTPMCRAYSNASIAVGTGAVVKLTFNAERFDTDTIHDTVTNNSRLTCKTAGVYQITANFYFENNSAGNYREGRILYNNSTYIGMDIKTPITGDVTAFSMTTIYELAVNDYVEIDVLQNSGSTLNVVANGNYSPEFSMVRVAPASSVA